MRAIFAILVALSAGCSRDAAEDARRAPPAAVVAGREASASRATPGAVVPDLPLVDQDGAPMTLRSGAGRVRIVTFIYTRCPLPDFCPLMVSHLEAVRRRANEEGLGNRLSARRDHGSCRRYPGRAARVR
jgi:cytochrome oxidase Cu insertion factor (SCO1/SenC/PrrC family)